MLEAIVTAVVVVVAFAVAYLLGAATMWKAWADSARRGSFEIDGSIYLAKRIR